MMSRRDQLISIINSKGSCKALHRRDVCPVHCVLTRDFCARSLGLCHNKAEIDKAYYEEAITIGIREGLLTEEEIFEAML